MAKRYLSIDEAAVMLGMESSELNRLREKGEIRAFADRGTWKFREDDLQELARARNMDSNPDIPMLGGEPSKKAEPKFDLSMFEDTPADDDSSLKLGEEVDERKLADQPTIVRGKGRDDLSSSDSDVRLVFDENLMPDSDPDVPSLSDSDSDVRLLSAPAPDSDSDVKLVPDSSSQKHKVKSIFEDDSDVSLVGQSGTLNLDSEVPDGSFVLGGEASGLALTGPGYSGLSSGVKSSSESSGKTMVGGMTPDEEEEGITLEIPNVDSGIALDGDSDITLDLGGNDSGISLDAGGTGSSLLLGSDSGISLAGPSDSGIALDTGSGSTKKKKSKKQADDLGGTLPMMKIPGNMGDDLAATNLELPSLGLDSQFELASFDNEEASSAVVLDEDTNKTMAFNIADDDDASDQSAVVLDDDEGERSAVILDDEDDTADEAPRSSRGGRKKGRDYEQTEEIAEELLDGDVIGEDDEVEMSEVFGTDDADFDESLETGESQADFAIPTASAGRMSAPVEAEWGAGPFVMLFLSSAVMVLTSFMMYEVVRTMWGGNDPSAGTEAILATFRGMLG